MAQLINRLLGVFLTTLLCSQSFAGVMNGNIFINNQNGGNNTVFFDGTTFGTSTNNLSSNLTLGELFIQSGVAASQIGDISINGVMTDGPVTSLFNGLFITQGTTGGNFVISDIIGSQLLSGTFGDGTFSGPSGNPVGSFKPDFVNFDGGSLLQFIKPTGGFVLSLSAINDTAGLSEVSGDLVPFVADFTAQFDVVGVHPNVPEPGTFFTLSPILLGLLARRRGSRKLAS